MEIEERLKSIKSQEGTSLYDHLVNVLGRLAEANPINPVRSFDEHSQFVRESKYNYTDVKNYRNADGRRDKGHSAYLDKTAKYMVVAAYSGIL